MRKIISLLACLLSILVHAQEINKPEAFLENMLIQYDNIRDLALSPKGDELFFTCQSFSGDVSALFYSKQVNGRWSKVQIASFSGRYMDLEPFFSADGLSLYFASNRPQIDGKESKDFDIWVSNRTSLDSNWEMPINLGAPVNTAFNEFYPSLSSNGNIYFTSDADSLNKDNIYYAQKNGNSYTNPVPLSDSINSSGYEFNAFVAPDESYIIFTAYNRADGFGSGDLYISYRAKNGQWMAAKNMGKKINSAQMDYCPLVHNKQLYFTSKRLSKSILPNKNLTYEEFLAMINRAENGQSKLYHINIASFLD